MTASFVGLDLGPAHDSTAVALLAREVERSRACYALRHLQRWPPGTPYPRVAEDVSRLLQAVPRWACRLVVDQTAEGRAVSSLFWPAVASTRRVHISAGHTVTAGEDGCTHVPKKELASVLQVDWCDDSLTCKLCSWWLRFTDPAFYRTYALEIDLRFFRCGDNRVRLGVVSPLP